MTFDLTTIAIFGIAALAYSLLIPPRLRGWMLMLTSVIAIYWLQPRLNIPRMDYILPTGTLILTVAIWWFTRKPDDDGKLPFTREDAIALGLTLVIVMAIAGTRFLDADFRLTSRPPEPLHVLLVLVGISAVLLALWRFTRNLNQWNILTGWILLVIGIFVVLKAEPLAVEVSRVIRGQMGRDTSLAAMIDLNWLGFSYVAFRLIHTLRDRQSGKLPALSLSEYITYIIFFPAYISGPIDRAERFIADFRALPDMLGLTAPRFVEGFTRIGVGIFKKFVIADTLALGMALNPVNAAQTDSAVMTWVLLYGYALRLFFDFSGYTDIAIGVGILCGIKLPENFNRPYLKNNITTFWQSWHMTLSTWARFYVFTPLSRVLLTRKPKPSPTLIVLLTQSATMVTIGLWHGITLNFLIWGIWHGLGLFAHKQWSDRTRKWYISLKDKPEQKRLWTVAGWFLTFHFVVLGWVWFALPDIDQSLSVFGKLFGLGA